MKIYLIPTIILLFFQCKSKSDIQQENHITVKTDTKEIFESKENHLNQVINNIYSCDEICLSFPKKISKDSLIKKKTIEVVIENNTENIIIAGEKYEIEKFYNGKWSKIVFNGMFTDVGYKINPKSKMQIDIPTYFLQNLSQGRYKIYQDVTTMSNKTKIYFVNEFCVV